MIYILKKTITASIMILLSLSLAGTITPEIADAAKTSVESADFTLPSDKVITGEMKEYSKASIIVDNVRYEFCRKTLYFATNDEEIPFHDIDAAEKVKLFENNNCVRKLKVLRFAQ